jgi:MoxR-like ATPase
MPASNANNWKIYQGDGNPREGVELPPAPPWRQFRDDATGVALQQDLKVNAALSLRRPLLITGNPGTGKSSLAYAVARELGLGKVLKWSITTRTTLKDGLYNYDAIARLQDAQASQEDNRQDTGNYITLGALGTAFLPTDLPRVLLIDEIDKSDIDLPNDLLNLLEDGEFPIPELQRLELSPVDVRTIERDTNNKQNKATVENGVIRCSAFPLVIMTSNGERDFPPPFLRRCLRLKMPNPNAQELQKIVEKHLGESVAQTSALLIQEFCKRIDKGGTLATDQLLNVIHIRTQENARLDLSKFNSLEEQLLKDLSSLEDV